jgi:hypothetical protein
LNDPDYLVVADGPASGWDSDKPPEWFFDVSKDALRSQQAGGSTGNYS